MAVLITAIHAVKAPPSICMLKDLGGGRRDKRGDNEAKNPAPPVENSRPYRRPVGCPLRDLNDSFTPVALPPKRFAPLLVPPGFFAPLDLITFFLLRS